MGDRIIPVSCFHIGALSDTTSVLLSLVMPQGKFEFREQVVLCW